MRTLIQGRFRSALRKAKLPDVVTLLLGEDSSILLVEGDITLQDADAIVNAANSSLMGGGGVDGAIHRVGGPAILEECKKIVAAQGPLPPGEAVATTGGKLRAGYVIHTVGPIYNDGAHGEPDILASCYRECLELADRMRLENIAFPSISTGAFGYPMRDAAKVALKTVETTLPDLNSVREVRFVLFGAGAMATYTAVLEEIYNNKKQRYRLLRRSR